MNVFIDNLTSRIEELQNLSSTESAYVSKPLLTYILHWLNLSDEDKNTEISTLKAALENGLDVDFTGTQWEAEWLANNKICLCKACNKARKCIALINQIGENEK